MIDLTGHPTASPAIHHVPVDPGTSWSTEVTVALDAAPDDDPNPDPQMVWDTTAVRSGICGAVTPRIVLFPDGTYRMYYTQILPRPNFPAGANDFGNASARILSAASSDGIHWRPESGVRLSPEQGGAGEFRVVSPDVVPVAGVDDRLRMYYECCRGPQSVPNSIRSAVSEDGLNWTVEPGVRLETPGCYYNSCRLILLADGRCRMYVAQSDRGIISAISNDAGLSFDLEDGTRVPNGDTHDSLIAFAPEIVRIENGVYRMYYAGYSHSTSASILTATSEDGLNWVKGTEPVISPGQSQLDRAKCSEMGLLTLPATDGEPPRFRLFYEACDGTARDERGIWRIVSRTTT